VVGELERVLVLEGVWKRYGRGRDRGVAVLEGVSLTVAPKEIVTVLGTRDQGKTTLLRIAAGMERADRGSVCLDGIELMGLKDRQLSAVLRTKIGWAGRDGPGMRMRMRDYVGLQLAAGRWWRKRKRLLRTAEAMERLGVADCAGARWEELSNWERARVELAQAIAPHPRLLVVDDLLDGLGLGKLQEATRLVRELAEEIGCGVLMAVSDHMSPAAADRVLRLEAGKLTVMADHTDPPNRPRAPQSHPRPSSGQAARSRRRP
jgi:putative ABC transport system ATP-binding protein